MGRCSVGRSTQKYTGGGGGGGGADLSSILTAHGDMIYANVSAQAANVSIGTITGHVLTVVAPGEVGWRQVTASGAVGNLQAVTTAGESTSVKVNFTNTFTSLEASGNVLVVGNVTASKFYGDGTTLTGVATAASVSLISSDLSSNSGRITDIETSVTGDIIYASGTNTLAKLNIGASGQVLESDGGVPVWRTPTQGLPTPYTQGDILYATGTNTLAKLNIGTSGLILKSDGSNPVWGAAPTGIWTETGVNNIIHYTSGFVGISTDAPTVDLQIGSNVLISDTNDVKLILTGNAYVSKNMKVVDTIDANEVRAVNFFVKKQIVTAERPQTTTQMII
tara:strand:- start:5351 stop:6358 length:1008 start_codon:yes stop_codon:yes gene_type:complete